MRTPQPLSLPSLSLLAPNKAVAKAATAWTTLIDRHRDEVARLRGLEGDRPRAVDADRSALAGALRANKADPGDKATQAADATIADCRRRVDALVVACDDARAELIETIEAERNAIQAHAAGTTADARARLLEVLTDLEVARAAVATSLTLGAWLTRFPTVTSKVAPPMLVTVPDLMGANGEPLPWATVLDALRAMGAPARQTPVARPAGQPFRQMVADATPGAA